MSKTKQYDHPLGKTNRNKVLQAVAILHNPRPHDITNWINSSQDTDFLNKVLPKTTTNLPTTDRYLPLHLQKPIIHERPNSKRITIRSVHNALNELRKLGEVEHLTKGRYQLTDKVKQDTRFLASIWHIQAQYVVFSGVNNLHELVNRLGLFVAYVFVQSMKRFDVKVEDKDKVALEWVNGAIGLEGLLMSFMARFVPIVNPNTKTRFEIPVEKYEELSNMLKDISPELYNKWSSQPL